MSGPRAFFAPALEVGAAPADSAGRQYDRGRKLLLRDQAVDGGSRQPGPMNHCGHAHERRRLEIGRGGGGLRLVRMHLELQVDLSEEL